MMKPPEKQTNYEDARGRAVKVVRSLSPAALETLGAVKLEGEWYRLNVLDAPVKIDLAGGELIYVRDKGSVPVEWQILILHYLSAREPVKEFLGWLSFADIPEARGYLPVFNQRVIGRLIGTAGRDRETFRSSCSRVGGERFDWGEEGYRFRVFPLLSVGIAWYAGDEELPPGASFVYSDNVNSLLPVEDMVVMAERVVSRLQSAARE